MKSEVVLLRQAFLLPRNVVAEGIGPDTFVDGGAGVVVDVVGVDPFAVGCTLLDVPEIAKICDVRMMRLCVLGLEPEKVFEIECCCYLVH